MKTRFMNLESDRLCAEARLRTGLSEFGDPTLEPRLALLANSIEAEADLHPIGRFLARAHLRGLLETRLRLADAWRKSEDRNGEMFPRPIFITGMPRSGSTFLHKLLAQDPDSRTPRVWEVMFPPIRPAPGAREVQWRIRKTAACLWGFRRIAPRTDSVHPVRALIPQECVAIHSYTLVSREFVTIFRVPAYETFLETADFRPAYAWQKRFLQHLQAGSAAKRWVLKAPDHVFSLDALFAVFPDATVVQTHRDPLAVLKSSCQLTEVLHRAFAWSRNRSGLGEREARVLADGVQRVTRFRDDHPELADRFVDIHYHRLVSDPLGTVRELYWQLNLPLSRKVVGRMWDVVFRTSRYARVDVTLADLGIDRRVEARRFAGYCARFGIPRL